MTSLAITGGHIAIDGAMVRADLSIEDGCLRPGSAAGRRRLDATGWLGMRGIGDMLGDACERQGWPRPGVEVDLAVALRETDAQLVANGITTAYHGLTWSWEPGFRGAANARRFLEALARERRGLAADTRVHLRQETFNLDAIDEIERLVLAGTIDCLAFNDHLEGTIKSRHRPEKIGKMVERSGLATADFLALVDRVHARADEVPEAVSRLARAARASGVPLLSHDDPTPEARALHRGLGCAIAEFPIDVATTRAAADAGDEIVFGAPNVMRGGSHTGCPSAAEMVGEGLCTILASDYYYPALPLAPFMLAARGLADVATAWALVSEGPARALGLVDRGRIAEGARGDIAVVEDRGTRPPAIVATLVAGRIVRLVETDRLS